MITVLHLKISAAYCTCIAHC